MPRERKGTSDKLNRPMKPSEVAALFNVSTRTVMRWVEEKRFLRYGITPFVTPGGDVRFDRDEVMRAIEEAKQRDNALREMLSGLDLTNLDRSRVLVVANQKGGVGKTTIAVGLAEGLAMMGYRVLIIDADPQGNTTSHLGYSNTRAEEHFRRFDKTVANLWDLEGKGQDLSLDEIIVPCDHSVGTDRLWLAPMDDSGLEIEHAITVTVLELAAKRGVLDGAKLASVLQNFYRTLPLKLEELLAIQQFDFVIIDTNPSLGPLTTSALIAGDTFITPVEPEVFSSEGMLRFHDITEDMLSYMNKKLEILGYVINHKSRKAKIRAEVVEMMRQFFGDKCFKTELPEDVAFVEAQKWGKGIQAYRPNSAGAEKMAELALEVVQRLEAFEQSQATVNRR